MPLLPQPTSSDTLEKTNFGVRRQQDKNQYEFHPLTERLEKKKSIKERLKPAEDVLCSIPLTHTQGGKFLSFVLTAVGTP